MLRLKQANFADAAPGIRLCADHSPLRERLYERLARLVLRGIRGKRPCPRCSAGRAGRTCPRALCRRASTSSGTGSRSWAIAASGTGSRPRSPRAPATSATSSAAPFAAGATPRRPCACCWTSPGTSCRRRSSSSASTRTTGLPARHAPQRGLHPPRGRRALLRANPQEQVKKQGADLIGVRALRLPKTLPPPSGRPLPSEPCSGGVHAAEGSAPNVSRNDAIYRVPKRVDVAGTHRVRTPSGSALSVWRKTLPPPSGRPLPLSPAAAACLARRRERAECLSERCKFYRVPKRVDVAGTHRGRTPSGSALCLHSESGLTCGTCRGRPSTCEVDDVCRPGRGRRRCSSRPRGSSGRR